LACAIAVAAHVPEELILVAADTRLIAIAPLEGLRVINPIDPPRCSSPDHRIAVLDAWTFI
jgi:hypothetical protein